MQSYKEVLGKIRMIEMRNAQVKKALARIVVFAALFSLVFIFILASLRGFTEFLLCLPLIRFVVSDPKAASSILVTVIPFLYFLLKDEQIDEQRGDLLMDLDAGIIATRTPAMADSSLDRKDVKEIIMDQLKKKIDEEVSFSEIKSK
jgi:hypothetical protein